MGGVYRIPTEVLVIATRRELAGRKMRSDYSGLMFTRCFKAVFSLRFLKELNKTKEINLSSLGLQARRNEKYRHASPGELNYTNS